MRSIRQETPDEEYVAARDPGLTCLLFSAEDFELGEFKPRPANAVEGNML
jgi:hypothetical protein